MSARKLVDRLGRRMVVTHAYTSGQTRTVCAAHETTVTDYSRTGASYSGVSHGAHRGYCDVCDRPVEGGVAS